MMWKTHLNFGILLGLIAIGFLHPAHPLKFMFIVVIAALFPDIDYKNSKTGKNFKLLSIVFNHRGWFHSSFALILFSLLAYYLKGEVLAWAVFTGYFSHLVLDSLTPQGIMPLAPLHIWKIKGRLKTNSPAEFLLNIVIILCIFIIVMKKINIYNIFTALKEVML